MHQLTLAERKPNQRDLILGVLKQHPGVAISALDFKQNRFGIGHIDAVSQRVGELRRAGHPIASSGKGGIATYTYGGAS